MPEKNKLVAGTGFGRCGRCWRIGSRQHWWCESGFSTSLSEVDVLAIVVDDCVDGVLLAVGVAVEEVAPRNCWPMTTYAPGLSNLLRKRQPKVVAPITMECYRKQLFA